MCEVFGQDGGKVSQKINMVQTESTMYHSTGNHIQLDFFWLHAVLLFACHCLRQCSQDCDGYSPG